MGRSRADQNREMRRENLREELKSRTYLQNIEKILVELDDPGLTGVRIKALQVKLNGYFRLLAKTLPDLKAIEIEATLKEAPKSRADLENILTQAGVDPRMLGVAGSA